MKTSPRQPRNEGNVLILTIVLTSVIGLTLAAYLTLVNTSFRLTSSSQNWNSLMPTVEAGIEEALAHLNQLGASTNRAVDGWNRTNTTDGTFYYKTRTMGNQDFEVFIGTSLSPEIRATATGAALEDWKKVTRGVLVTTRRYSGRWLGLVAKGAVTLGPNSNIDSFNAEDPTISTNGKYDPAKRNDQGFIGSVNGNIDGGGGGQIFGNSGTGPLGFITNANVGDLAFLNGGGTGVQPGHYENDLNLSFPEVQPPFNSAPNATSGSITTTTYNYSTNSITTNVFPSPAPTNAVTTNISQIVSFTYPSPAPAGGVVTNQIPTTSATWPGSAYLPITTNTTAITGGTSTPAIGTYVPPLSIVTNTVKITGGGGPPKYVTVITYSYNRIDDYDYEKPSYTYDDITYTYDKTTVVSTNVTTTSYRYLLGDGNYMNNSVRFSGNQEIMVVGDAVWYVVGDFDMAGQGQLTVAPGASLNLYCGGDVKIAGNGWVNGDQDAYALQFWGLPSCTEFNLNGNANYVGTVYAPNAVLKGAGGGNNEQDFAGAGIFKEVDYNGKFSFHFDERLGEDEKIVKFRLASWNEY